MRKIIFAAAVATGALSLAACSQQTEKKTGEAMDSAAADAQANADSAGETVDSAATAAGDAVKGVADTAAKAATDAKNAAEADIQGESTTKAAAD
ncbi:MAG: hypothetical protein ABIP41_00505 [Croceibacterium sp.]